jgi:hypothetical protein
MENIQHSTFNLEHPAVAIRSLLECCVFEDGCWLLPLIRGDSQRTSNCSLVDAGFPLTPALSPSEGERENYPQFQRKLATEGSSNTSENFAGSTLLFLSHEPSNSQGQTFVAYATKFCHVRFMISMCGLGIVESPHEVRSSGREPARLTSEGSQSRLTSVTTVLGFKARNSTWEKSLLRRGAEGQGEGAFA